MDIFFFFSIRESFDGVRLSFEQQRGYFTSKRFTFRKAAAYTRKAFLNWENKAWLNRMNNKQRGQSVIILFLILIERLRWCQDGMTGPLKDERIYG